MKIYNATYKMYRRLGNFRHKKFSPTTTKAKIKQAKYSLRRIIRYISHVYVSSKGHSDEN